VPLINADARRCGSAAAAITAAALLLCGTAHAQPAPAPVDPKAGCEAPEFGGVFVPVTPEHAECHYIVSGAFYYDLYDNGAYTGTLVYRNGEKVPTERPPIPETFTAPGGVPLFGDTP
jgi:hypothetical protein